LIETGKIDGKRVVYIGTGKYLEASDLTNALEPLFVQGLTGASINLSRACRGDSRIARAISV
jgi:Tfp pilus tip-associated adhesin PilY1